MHCASFDPFNNDEGIKMWTEARPGYMAAGGPPNQEQVSGAHRVRHDNEVMGQVYKNLTNTLSVSCSTDGWTDINSAGLHNYMVCNPVPFLLGAERHPNQTEAAEVLFKMAVEMSEKVREQYEVQDLPPPVFIGFCTDSPNGNKGMRRMLTTDERSKDFGILPYGCVCHGLNNFGKDVVSKLGLLSKTLNQGKVLAAVFRNVKFCRFHLRSAQIEAYGNTRQLKMPVDTRWNSNIASLASVSNNKRALVNVKSDSVHGNLAPAINLATETAGQNKAGWPVW